jgi:predicted enzyme related to lactoylglutathione lyase
MTFTSFIGGRRSIARMAERTSYAPGTFSWAELVTSDAGAAKAFYTEAFGWSYDDNPIPDGSVYSMALRDGKQVAALFASDEQPPHWNCYVTVASADETAAKAKEAGANVMAEPFDVMDVGRMAVFADPGGGVLCVWEPRASIGAQLVNTPGALTWNDLVTSDPEPAAEFYGRVFGWTTEELPNAGGYRVIKNGDRSNGGIMPSEGGPQSWVPYFGHEDVNRLLEEVPARGGKVLNGPISMPGGAIGVISDPQGAVFAAWTGTYDDAPN